METNGLNFSYENKAFQKFVAKKTKFLQQVQFSYPAKLSVKIISKSKKSIIFKIKIFCNKLDYYIAIPPPAPPPQKKNNK